MTGDPVSTASTGELKDDVVSGRKSGEAARLRAITKTFYGIPANDRVDFDLRWGEIHALLGENGAGKSTLCSVLAGLYHPDSGEIHVGGDRVQLASHHQALEHGVGMVYQHFRLVDRFTVAENLALGHPETGFLTSRGSLERQVAELGRRYGLEVSPKAAVWQLSVGEQQRVEILKLLYRGVRILIPDEPTAVLTPQEAQSVAGNGQRELAEVITGLRRSKRGQILLGGVDITRSSTLERIKLGLGFVPEDRMRTGMAGGLPLSANLALKAYREPPLSKGPLVSKNAVEERARGLEEQFDIRGVRWALPTSLLSGGNIQRAILARELSARPRVLVAASPTRGLDVAAIEAIRRILLDERDAGTAILMISEDLEEILDLSDLILVLYEGRIVGRLEPDDASPEVIGMLMAGRAVDTE